MSNRFLTKSRRRPAQGSDESVQTARLCLDMVDRGQYSESLSLCDSLASGELMSAEACDILNRVYSVQGELTKALNMAERAAALEPGRPHYLYNLATAQRAAGKFEDAEAAFDEVIKKSPRDWEAWKNRSDLREQTQDRNHIEDLKLALRGITDWRGEVQVCFALGKELEDIGEYDQSFSFLKRGNNIRRRHTRYDVSGDIRTMRLIADTFDGRRERAPGFSTTEPIFILGLPRTGSTLLDRILGMHGDIYSAGELHQFATTMVSLIQLRFDGVRQRRDNMVKESLTLDPESLGQSYIDATRPRTGHTSKFIDKMPLNFLYLGLIHRALPFAKVIHSTRHPIDTCFAIYKTLFEQAYPYSYDMIDLARYFIGYSELMDHWRQVLPEFILDISYEGLVDSTEQEVRRAADFCGIEWQEEMLEFHRSSSPTNTASAAQVHRPIYNSSVRKWKKFERHLEPLIAKLSVSGVKI